ncbi:hypothetical protein EDF50_1019 [Frigoribacterium sp. PhB24]|nr:hypothetical protein EDF50_1019 [Frigoribacterium sp. PhB24]
MTTLAETFLRRPYGLLEYVADAVRVVAALSVVVVGVGWGVVEIAVLMLALLGTLVPRMLGLRATFDLMVGVAALGAAWSSVFELYTRVAGYDTVVHFVLNGLLAAVFVVLARRAGWIVSLDRDRDGRGGAGRSARVGSVLLTVAFGLAAGTLWEMGEWAGHTLIDSAIFVGYDDTIGDLAAGGLGSLLAGLGLPFLVGGDVRGRAARASSSGGDVDGAVGVDAVGHGRSSVHHR